MTQITSNTAAIAIVVPIVIIRTFQGPGINPLPFVYIVSAIGNCGYALPSSAGGPAVPAGYGINLQTMLTKGLALLSLITLLAVGYLCTVYWPGFAEASPPSPGLRRVRRSFMWRRKGLLCRTDAGNGSRRPAGLRTSRF